MEMNIISAALTICGSSFALIEHEITPNNIINIINVNILQPLHVVEDPEMTKWQKV